LGEGNDLAFREWGGERREIKKHFRLRRIFIKRLF
jgi:hypothetical protein